MESMLIKGVELAIFGMGTVFLFLTLLVLVTLLMSWLIRLLETKKIPPSGPTDPRLIAVITAAIQQFRSDHTRS